MVGLTKHYGQPRTSPNREPDPPWKRSNAGTTIQISCQLTETNTTAPTENFRAMTTVAIAGATGVVGKRALDHLLQRDDVETVIAIGRRSLALESEKLISKVADFQDVESLAAVLPESVDLALCTLGTTRKKAGSKEAFRAVDYDAVLNFAQATLEKGARHFLVVTAIGSDSNSLAFYSRVKGEVEEALMDLEVERLTILRPSIIDDEGERPEHRLGEQIALVLSRTIFSVVGKTRKYAPITADTIARALLHLAFDDDEESVRIVESDQLHSLGA